MKIYILTLVLLSLFLSISAQEKGKASYYANRHHNRKTASGILYHKDSLYCAHKKHPFGTLLRVKNMKNEKEVVVKVIDRGPFVRGRIVDVSRAAADSLGFVRAGTAKVEVWAVDSVIVDCSIVANRF